VTTGASNGVDTRSVSLGETGRPANTPTRPDIGALYNKHRDKMYRAALRVLGPNRQSEVEDAVSDAMVKVMRHYERPVDKDPDNWAGWLVRITQRCAIDRAGVARRHDHNELVSLVGEDSPSVGEDRRRTRPRTPGGGDPVGDEAIERERAQRLRGLIAQLPQDEATIVHLRIIEDIPTNAEVGQMLDPPRTGQSVGQVLRRALDSFEDELRGDGQ
jgi:RNA polymerase sigma factor (sigma-70 family)